MTARHSDYHGELLVMKLLPVRCHGPINSLFKGLCPLQYNQHRPYRVLVPVPEFPEERTERFLPRDAMHPRY